MITDYSADQRRHRREQASFTPLNYGHPDVYEKSSSGTIMQDVNFSTLSAGKSEMLSEFYVNRGAKPKSPP